MAGNSTFEAGKLTQDLKLEETLYQTFPYLRASIKPKMSGVDKFTKHYYISQLGVTKGDIQEGKKSKDKANFQEPIVIDAFHNEFKAIQWGLSAPVVIANSQKVLNVVDLVSDARKDIQNTLVCPVGYETPYLWAIGQATGTAREVADTSDRLVYTTGATVPARGLAGQGAKSITMEDIINIKKRVFQQSKGGSQGVLNALINVDMMHDLMEMPQWSNQLYRQNFKNSNIMPEFDFEGIHWYVTSGVDTSIGGTSIKDMSILKAVKGTAKITLSNFNTAATTGMANTALFWYTKSVLFGYVDSKMFINKDNAQYRGDIFNGEIMYGAEYLNHDYRGTMLLVQDIV